MLFLEEALIRQHEPTYGLAEQVIQEYQLDTFFFVPVGNFFKKKELIDEKNRYEMLKLACREKEKMKVSPIELNRKEELSTIDIFREIRKAFPQDKVFYVMGADNFEKLPNWKESRELMEKYQFIVLNRTGIEIEKIIEKQKIFQDNQRNFTIFNPEKSFSMSSTEVRQNIKEGNWKLVEQKVMPLVVSYIREKKLYQDR